MQIDYFQIPNEVWLLVFKESNNLLSLGPVSSQWRTINGMAWHDVFKAYNGDALHKVVTLAKQLYPEDKPETSSQRVKLVFQTVMKYLHNIYGSEEKITETAGLYSTPWSAERLNHLMQWAQETELKQATNLNIFFGALGAIIPEDCHYLSRLNPDLTVIEKAKGIRTWMTDMQALLQLIPELKLNLLGLTELPPEIRFFTGLTELACTSNAIESFPAEIGQLTNLTDLQASFCHLKSLPKEIGQLKKLKNLWLQGNSLEQIPEEICSLTQLQTLYLQGNRLVNLPVQMDQLSQLQTLNLDNNHFETLPPCLGALPKLKQFTFANNYKLRSLPHEIISSTNPNLSRHYEVMRFATRLTPQNENVSYHA